MRTRPAVPSVRRRRRRLVPRALPAAPVAPGIGGPPGIGAAPAGLPMAGGAPGGMPAMKKGGRVKKTGPHMLHKGEKVIPKGKAAKMRKPPR